MIIHESVCDEIIALCSGNLIETGGIIGGRNNIVSEFEFDNGDTEGSRQHYIPNIIRLNACIEKWQSEGIQFYGIVHNHFQDENELSFGDTKYIEIIMKAMPKYVQSLYFPIVLPQRALVSFQATMVRNKINIISDDVKIIPGKRNEHEKNS